MTAPRRLIARLDVKNDFVIKGIHLEGLRKIGNPNELAKKYYFEGVDEIKIKPGINLKAALNFEFGSAKSASAIEVGFLGEVFPNEVIIMPTARNYSFYPTAFITLFYGRKY